MALDKRMLFTLSAAHDCVNCGQQLKEGDKLSLQVVQADDSHLAVDAVHEQCKSKETPE